MKADGTTGLGSRDYFLNTFSARLALLVALHVLFLGPLPDYLL